jgi:RNA polymerase sigma factor (TIGR02999 family)
MVSQAEITELLTQIRDGRKETIDRLFPLVYNELRRIAHRQLGSDRRGQTLETTALVHEAYLRLVDQTHAEWRDRAHFLAVAAMAMRQILIGQARKRRAEKRGGGRPHLALEEGLVSVEDQAEALLELDQALHRLAVLDQRLAKVVECRFFGGLTEEEIAESLGVTARTVRRDWVKAKALLYEELGP